MLSKHFRSAVNGSAEGRRVVLHWQSPAQSRSSPCRTRPGCLWLLAIAAISRAIKIAIALLPAMFVALMYAGGQKLEAFAEGEQGSK
jgi:hypothetical protein